MEWQAGLVTIKSSITYCSKGQDLSFAVLWALTSATRSDGSRQLYITLSWAWHSEGLESRKKRGDARTVRITKFTSQEIKTSLLDDWFISNTWRPNSTRCYTLLLLQQVTGGMSPHPVFVFKYSTRLISGKAGKNLCPSDFPLVIYTLP